RAVPRLRRPRQPEGARDEAPPLERLAHGAAAPARLRFQPGADGLRRDALHGAQAEVPALSDARVVPRLSVQSRQRAPVILVVTAAVIERHGAYLVTRRQRGVHLEGYWEFPGGKCEPGESLGDCLRRELQEELGVDAIVADEIFTVTHDYPDRSVELH